MFSNNHLFEVLIETANITNQLIFNITQISIDFPEIYDEPIDEMIRLNGKTFAKSKPRLALKMLKTASPSKTLPITQVVPVQNIF